MRAAYRSAVVLTLVLVFGGAAEAARAGAASGRPAQFTATAGEHNDLSVTEGSGGSVHFTDARAPINPGLWCVPFPIGQAQCDPDGDPRDTDGGGVTVTLGDGDDRAIVRWVPGTQTHPGAIRVIGGTGNDDLQGSAGGVLRFEGGDGDDALSTGAAAGAYLLGGAGADRMASSSACCSVAGYDDHDSTGVRVSLDNKANDGVRGEGDDVRTSGVVGSPGPDVITGDARANAITGSGGSDALSGGAGDDTIIAVAGDGPAGSGPDGRDVVTCGAGDDQVTADEADTVRVDCERVFAGSAVSPELVLDLGAARASHTGWLKVVHRVKFPNRDNALQSRSTFRLVDRTGRAVSSTVGFVLGVDADVAVQRVRLNRATRARLARSRSGALRLIAQRMSRDARADSPATGYEQFNEPVKIRRARRR